MIHDPPTKVAEFDTPLNLFDKEDSIFRSMCVKAGLSREDILRIRRVAGKDVSLLPDAIVAASQ
jgi:ATP-binding cassette, subfamily C (CFTR/MRP), member 1